MSGPLTCAFITVNITLLNRLHILHVHLITLNTIQRHSDAMIFRLMIQLNGSMHIETYSALHEMRGKEGRDRIQIHEYIYIFSVSGVVKLSS